MNEGGSDERERVSIWSIDEDTHKLFVFGCATASVLAAVFCLAFWSWTPWEWSHLYSLPKELATSLALSVAATWTLFNIGEAMGIALENFKRRERVAGGVDMARKVREFADSNGENIPRDKLLKFLEQKEEENYSGWFFRLLGRKGAD